MRTLLYTRGRRGTVRGTTLILLAALFGLASAYRPSGSPPPSAPVVVSVSLDHGPNSGVSGVVLTGTNLTGATQVLFGPNAASFTVDSDTQITANLGAVSTTGWVDVSVTNPDGTGTLVHAFDYFVPPAIIGRSCAGLTWSGSPTLGQNYTLTAGSPGYRNRLLVSWSSARPVRTFNSRFGRCTLWFAPEIHVPLVGSPPSYTFSIPNDVSLIGARLKTQAIIQLGGFPFGLYLRATDALEAVIGE